MLYSKRWVLVPVLASRIPIFNSCTYLSKYVAESKFEQVLKGSCTDLAYTDVHRDSVYVYMYRKIAWVLVDYSFPFRTNHHGNLDHNYPNETRDLGPNFHDFCSQRNNPCQPIRYSIYIPVAFFLL